MGADGTQGVAWVVIRHKDRPPTEDELSEPRASAARRAQERVPLASVLTAYHVGGRIIWDELLVEVRADETPQLLATADRVQSYIQAVTAVVATSYPCGRLLSDLTAGGNDDDVALLAVGIPRERACPGVEVDHPCSRCTAVQVCAPHELADVYVGEVRRVRDELVRVVAQHVGDNGLIGPTGFVALRDRAREALSRHPGSDDQDRAPGSRLLLDLDVGARWNADAKSPEVVERRAGSRKKIGRCGVLPGVDESNHPMRVARSHA